MNETFETPVVDAAQLPTVEAPALAPEAIDAETPVAFVQEESFTDQPAVI